MSQIPLIDKKNENEAYCKNHSLITEDWCNSNNLDLYSESTGILAGLAAILRWSLS